MKKSNKSRLLYSWWLWGGPYQWGLWGSYQSLGHQGPNFWGIVSGVG